MNQVPDPRPTYERAADQMTALIASVRPELLDAPTPCEEFTIRDLLDHVVATTQGFARIGEDGRVTEGVFEQPLQVPDDGWAEAYAKARDGLVAAWLDDARLETRYAMGWADLSGREVLAAATMDAVAHGWDLARALGRGEGLDEELGEYALAVARRMAPGDQRGEGVPFGPVLTAPDGADAYGRLAAWLGRPADWTPEGRVVA
ncbi:TIGR03086 family metal-binding protein [Allostreptomyces psammosilenae]|uniref:Uncharacterized protein (TIGR03086 family) n=1 Tax=Allostreptomyces psammosilenae TaxID=1892865 RepID=A0A853A442_9ACTN|nr:TIGR03086 family metal-binding protein [Allostreptomyces psammosilenae]NYI05471.1 uncharacterized protein (TIGR03086 family) [Allostreptomyces psammosilenae]